MKDYPYCFGKLDQVFPMAEEGLRQTPESCFPCRCKTECLRSAMAGAEGIQVREEMLERASRSGTMGFLERWSRKKVLANRKKDFPTPNDETL